MTGSDGGRRTGSEGDPDRVLQILPDTEATEQNLAALSLHKSLAVSGWAVRTLALSPGRRSDLAEVVPVMAPVRRSLAAVGQFRVEQAWADVVVLQGLATASVARAAGTSPKRILALGPEVSRWAATSKISRFDAYLLRSVDQLVVNSRSELQSLGELAAELPNVGVIEFLSSDDGSGTEKVPDDQLRLDCWLKCLSSALPSQP